MRRERAVRLDRPDFCDAELERLTGLIGELFGEDVVCDAIERTWLRARLQSKRTASFAEMKEALKVELRRMVKAH